MHPIRWRVNYAYSKPTSRSQSHVHWEYIDMWNWLKEPWIQRSFFQSPIRFVVSVVQCIFLHRFPQNRNCNDWLPENFHSGKTWSLWEPQTGSGKKERKGRFGAHAIMHVAAGAYLPTPWFFEPTKCPDDRTDYCLDKWWCNGKGLQTWWGGTEATIGVWRRGRRRDMAERNYRRDVAERGYKRGVAMGPTHGLPS